MNRLLLAGGIAIASVLGSSIQTQSCAPMVSDFPNPGRIISGIVLTPATNSGIFDSICPTFNSLNGTLTRVDIVFDVGHLAPGSLTLRNNGTTDWRDFTVNVQFVIGPAGLATALIVVNSPLYSGASAIWPAGQTTTLPTLAYMSGGNTLTVRTLLDWFLSSASRTTFSTQVWASALRGSTPNSIDILDYSATVGADSVQVVYFFDTPEPSTISLA